MKQVTNQSMQGQMVFLSTERGAKGVWLSPGQDIVVPESYLSDHIKNLVERKLLTVQSA